MACSLFYIVSLTFTNFNYIKTSLVSVNFMEHRAPTSKTAAVVRIGNVLLMLMKWANVKFPIIAAIRLTALRKPYPVPLKEKERHF